MPEVTTNATVRPLRLGDVLSILNRLKAEAPAAAPAAPQRDRYVRATGSLQSARFAGNPELERIAAGAVLGPQSSPEAIRAVQQALTDMAFLVPLGASVSGTAPSAVDVPLPRPRPKDIVAANVPAPKSTP